MSTRRSARHSLVAADAEAPEGVEPRHGDIEMASDVRAIAAGEVAPHPIAGAADSAIEDLVPPPAAITADERMDED